MKFKCEVDMNNAAFDIRPFGELARILHSIVVDGREGKIMDFDGNTVGKWELIE